MLSYFIPPNVCALVFIHMQMKSLRTESTCPPSKRVTMSGLLQDQLPHPDCCDKTTVRRDSPDHHRGGKEPLQGLTLASHTVLEEAQKRGRLKCLKCGGSRMFFCYTCCLLVGVTPKEIPSVKVCKSLELV